MAERIRVFELARELGVKSPHVLRIAGHLNITVKRVAATLTPGQAMRIRDEFHTGNWVTSARALRPPQPVRDNGWDLRYATCSCCDLRFQYPAHREAPNWCTHCSEHFPMEGESPERAVSRHSGHEERLREAYGFAASKATEYEGRMKAAFESRQKWKVAVAEVMLAHEPNEDGKCELCGDQSPCPSIRILWASNRGIAREVERLGTLNPAALERELYGIDPLEADLRYDDDPFLRGERARQSQVSDTG